MIPGRRIDAALKPILLGEGIPLPISPTKPPHEPAQSGVDRKV